MSADMHSTREIERVIRRRASDQDALLSAEQESAARDRVAAERIARNLGWSALGRDVHAGGPKWAQPIVDAPRRKTDVEELLRDRADGTLDIVKLSRREAIALGLVPTFRERVVATWRTIRFWFETFGAPR